MLCYVILYHVIYHRACHYQKRTELFYVSLSKLNKYNAMKCNATQSNKIQYHTIYTNFQIKTYT